MRMARRPDYAGQLLTDCLLKPTISVTGYVFYAHQAPFGELLQEGLPGLLRLAERRVKAENLPLALFIDADRQQDRSRPNSALPTNLHVHGVENQKGIFPFQRSPACGP